MYEASYLCLKQNDTYYAVEESHVVKILPGQKLCALPINCEDIEGLLLIDEHLAAVVKLGEKTVGNYIVVVKDQHDYMGIGVTEVIGTMLLKEETWVHYDQKGCPFVCEVQGKNIYYLDIFKKV